MSTKKRRATNCFPPHLLCCWIRDPGWIKVGIRDKYPGSATLLTTELRIQILIRILLVSSVPVPTITDPETLQNFACSPRIRISLQWYRLFFGSLIWISLRKSRAQNTLASLLGVVPICNYERALRPLIASKRANCWRDDKNFTKSEHLSNHIMFLPN